MRNFLLLSVIFLLDIIYPCSVNAENESLPGKQFDESLEISIATSLIGEKKYDEAMTCLDRVLEANPGNAMALYRKGMILHCTGDLTGAVELLEKALERMVEIENDSSRALVLQELARVQAGKGDAVRAEESINLALSFDPENVSFYMTKAEILLRANRLKEAAELLRVAARLAADSFEPRYRLAMVLHRLGEYREGIKILTELEKKEAFDPEITFNLGSFYFRDGQVDRAKRKWLEVIEIFPASRFASLAKEWTKDYKPRDTVLESDSFACMLSIPSTWFLEQEVTGERKKVWYFSRPVGDSSENQIVRPTLAVIARSLESGETVETLCREWTSLIALGGAEYRALPVRKISTLPGLFWEYSNTVDGKAFRGLIAVLVHGKSGVVIWMNASSGALDRIRGDFETILKGITFRPVTEEAVKVTPDSILEQPGGMNKEVMNEK